MKKVLLLIAGGLLLNACSSTDNKEQTHQTQADSAVDKSLHRFDIYAPVKLTTDLDKISENDKAVLPLLIEAARVMDTLFWLQSFGQPQNLDTISDPKMLRFAEINYGPWDRLDGNKPFVPGVGPKPLGAQFYPEDMTKKELEDANLEDKLGLYSIIRRTNDGQLKSIPYHIAYAPYLKRAAGYLEEASALTDNPELKNYFSLRAQALLSDQFDESDIAWLNAKTNAIDIIIGPIENYEDALYNARTAYEAYVLVKDKEWSERLEKYIAYLPELQEGLPVESNYKAEKPGSEGAQLNVYDVVYYAGDCNSGGKTIAVNLPNDETIQKEVGTRRSQLKNAMRAKFDKILVPIAGELVADDQVKHITFEAFFANTMFHEVAHGLGIKNTITGNGTVREALQEHFSALEEGKADILGLYMVEQLFEKGAITEGELMDYYTTFMAGIFRSVRFGASSAHGKANMMRFNFFSKKGAFSRDETTGKYSVNPEKMKAAIASLSAVILKLQGDGNKLAVEKMMEDMGTISPQLQADLDRLMAVGIPVDIVFEQGVEALGL